ncbi:MAG: hypothetical protein DRR00_28085 [Candidatus Parabeggiatoa sp. nov. 3]|nr:MAG: hypothetical protein DRR00_28085 [Gammaproteobacteria bacterium]RKZ58028.1 MAG: hypothetical protein DRQ99_26045 [Gammaproteobacteria bacterium]
MNNSSTIAFHVLLLIETLFLSGILSLYLFKRFNLSQEKKHLFEKQYILCNRIVISLFIVIFYFTFVVEAIYWANINYLYISSIIFMLCLVFRKTNLTIIILLVLLLLENILLVAGFSAFSLSLLMVIFILATPVAQKNIQK